MKKIVDKIRKKIGLRLYNKARQIYLKNSICNIGKIVEEKDKIICYADQKNVNRYKENRATYRLTLNGINQTNEKIKNIVEKYKLNKKVYYVFDGIKFDTVVYICSLDPSIIIFKNCTFDMNIGIMFGYNITFQNNKYMNYYPNRKYFLTASEVNKITFFNDNYVNRNELQQYGESCFGMQINAKEVEFINSKFDLENSDSMNITAKRTKIENSELKVNDAYIESQSIDFMDSIIIAQNGVMIENKNCDFVGNIQSPIVLYNGIHIANNKKELNKISKEEALLNEARHNLIKKLRDIRNYCRELNDNKIEDVKDILNNQPIIKIIK